MQILLILRCKQNSCTAHNRNEITVIFSVALFSEYLKHLLKARTQKIKANEKENLPFTKAVESVFRVREVSYGRLEFLSVCL